MSNITLTYARNTGKVFNHKYHHCYTVYDTEGKSDSLRLNNCVVGTKLSCHGKSAQISGHLFEARSVKWAIDLHQSY